jgi:hypothetical protein
VCRSQDSSIRKYSLPQAIGKYAQFLALPLCAALNGADGESQPLTRIDAQHLTVTIPRDPHGHGRGLAEYATVHAYFVVRSVERCARVRGLVRDAATTVSSSVQMGPATSVSISVCDSKRIRTYNTSPASPAKCMPTNAFRSILVLVIGCPPPCVLFFPKNPRNGARRHSRISSTAEAPNFLAATLTEQHDDWAVAERCSVRADSTQHTAMPSLSSTAQENEAATARTAAPAREVRAEFLRVAGHFREACVEEKVFDGARVSRPTAAGSCPLSALQGA